jgi:hypothetical protein
MSNRRIRGDKAFRRLLRNIDPSARVELGDTLDRIAPRLRNLVKLRTPSRTGALSRGIQSRVLRRSLKLRVGLLTKGARGKLFYGYIVHWGRKGRTVTAKRRTKNGVSSYAMRVRAMPARKFVRGAYPIMREEIQRETQGLWEKILTRAASGVGND